jgi:hypothetical protein
MTLFLLKARSFIFQPSGIGLKRSFHPPTLQVLGRGGNTCQIRWARQPKSAHKQAHPSQYELCL